MVRYLNLDHNNSYYDDNSYNTTAENLGIFCWLIQAALAIRGFGIRGFDYSRFWLFAVLTIRGLKNRE